MLQRCLASVLVLLCACEHRGGIELDGVTTIPARVSAGETSEEAPQVDDAVDDHGAILADPSALALSQIGYRGAPPPLTASAERRHAVGNLALAESQWERAIAAFRAVLAEHPDSGQDFRDLALAHAGADELEPAAHALAEALTREFPHAWHDYLQDPGFTGLRASAEHAALEDLATRLRTLHEQARVEGTPTTVTWTPSASEGSQRSRGAQAGVMLGGRFIPLAPRVWGTTVRADTELVVDAYFDRASGRVVDVTATAHPRLDAVRVQVHDAASGRVLAHRQLEGRGAVAFEIDTASLRVREAGQPWLDLRGRRSAAQDEPAAVVVVRATGLASEQAETHRIALAD